MKNTVLVQKIIVSKKGSRNVEASFKIEFHPAPVWWAVREVLGETPELEGYSSFGGNPVTFYVGMKRDVDTTIQEFRQMLDSDCRVFRKEYDKKVNLFPEWKEEY